MGKYKELALNLGLFALNSVVTKLISFFLVPLYTAYMSAGEYGLTDMANTVISLILPLATLDMSEAAVRYIVGDKVNKERYVAVSVVVTSASVLFVAILTPLFNLAAFGGLGDYKGWFISVYAATAFSTLCGEVARAAGEVKLIPICAGISSATTLICAIIFIASMDMGIVGYFASVLAGAIISIAVYLTVGGICSMTAKGVCELKSGGVVLIKNTILPMVRYAFPLIPNSLFWWIGTSINRLFITGMLGISASGLFAAAGKIPGLLNTLYSIFLKAWQLSAFQESGNGNIAKFYATIFRLVSALLTTLCALLSLLAPWISSIMLQGETFDAWPMISILLVANLMNVFNSFFGTVYTSTMHTSYVMKSTVLGAISCVVFTPLLIPIMGTYGACVASAIGQGSVFIMRAYDSRKYIDFDAGWSALVPTILILIAQSAVTALRINGWQYISGVCLGIVVLLQGIRIIPLVKTAILRLSDKRL